MKEFITKHKFGLITAFLIGLICVLPQIIFIATLEMIIAVFTYFKHQMKVAILP